MSVGGRFSSDLRMGNFFLAMFFLALSFFFLSISLNVSASRIFHFHIACKTWLRQLPLHDHCTASLYDSSLDHNTYSSLNSNRDTSKLWLSFGPRNTLNIGKAVCAKHGVLTQSILTYKFITQLPRRTGFFHNNQCHHHNK